MIYRGTTPTHIFSFPFDPNELSSIYITYTQRGNIIIEKTIDDIEFDTVEETMKVTLSQEDTLAFFGANPRIRTVDTTVFIQVRAGFANGEAWASEIMKDRVGDILKDGFIEA